MGTNRALATSCQQRRRLRCQLQPSANFHVQNKHKVWLYKDKQTGQMKGDGTVTYEDPFSAASAVQWFNDKEFKGACDDPRPCSSPLQP